MGTRIKSRTINNIHGGVVPKVFTQKESSSAVDRTRTLRRRVPGAGIPPDIKKPLSAGSVPRKLPGLKPLVNGHGRDEDGTATEEDEQAVSFTNVPSAWEAETPGAGSSRPDSGASRPPNTREIAAKDILTASMETDYSRVYDIDVHGSRIGRLEHLDKFTRVRVLDASCNYIAAIENLQNNTDLRELKLYDNQIRAIQNLDSLTQLCNLQLQHNKISTIGKGLNALRKLRVLRLDGNQITKIDVRELASCALLTSLNLSSNKLDNIAAVSCLPNLEELYGANNRLRTVADISRCKKLQEVDFTNNRLTDISGLKGLPHLRTLQLSHNLLSSMKSLGKSKCLEELYVSHNRLVDLSGLCQQCPNMQILDLADNCIEEFQSMCSLGALPELVELSISGNPCCREGGPVTNYSSVLHEQMPSLEMLDGVPLKRPSSRLGSTPLMRPMSANSVVSSRQVENQIKSIEYELASFEKEFANRFDSFRSTMDSLPEQYSGTASHQSSNSAPATSNARPVSRCGKRSRIRAAQDYALYNDH